MGDRGERQHWQLSSCPHGLPDLRMGSFWERNVSEIFFSEFAEDYQHQQPPALEEETDGFVCVSPDSGDSELETFIDDGYDICADAIEKHEEIENLKREEEHFAQPEIDEVNNGEQQLATFKVPENKAKREQDMLETVQHKHIIKH